MTDCNKGPDAHNRTASPDDGLHALRDSILAQTVGVVRRRRHRRRFAFGTALIMCYLAGALSMYAWRDTQPRQLASSAEADTAQHEQLQDKATLPKNPDAPEMHKTVKKLRNRPSQFEALCRIGDRYLYRKADTLEAIRGYRRALRVATPEELKICPQRDSWLLMALKQELQRKENRNENRGV